MRPFLTGCIIVLLLGCSGQEAPPPPAPTPQPTLAATATSEPSLNVLCSVAEEWCVAINEEYERRSGIEVHYERLSAGAALARLREHASDPEFDVYFGGPADGYVAATQEGLLQPYLPSARAQIPPSMQDPAGHWTGAYVGVLAFCSNPEALARLGVEPPQSWDDLLDPRFEGQLVLSHPATSGTAYTMLWTLVTRYDGDREQALAYFKALHPLVLTYTRSGITAGEMVAQGEAAVTVTFTHSCLGPTTEESIEPLVSYPAEGTGYEIGGLALLEGAHSPNAARGYIDFVLSEEGQALPFTTHWFVLPTVARAPVHEKAPSAAKLLDYDFIAAGEARDALVERFIAEIAPAPAE